MKTIFGMISRIAVVLIITRHTAKFVDTYYWWFVVILLIGLIGQLILSVKEKNRKSKSLYE